MRVFGRLTPKYTASLMDELTRYKPYTLVAHDDGGLKYYYPRSLMR